MDSFSIGACRAELLTQWDEYDEEDEANSDMYWDSDESDESFSTAVESVDDDVSADELDAESDLIVQSGGQQQLHL